MQQIARLVRNAEIRWTVQQQEHSSPLVNECDRSTKTLAAGVEHRPRLDGGIWLLELLELFEQAGEGAGAQGLAW